MVVKPDTLLKPQSGFTLIKLVIGIALFSAVLTIILGLIIPQAIRSVDPIYQVKGTELAQSMLNEISSKFYDENSDRTGGQIRCSEDQNGDGDLTDPGESICTVPASLGPDLVAPGVNEGRSDFDDVDDYHGFVYDPTNNLNDDNLLFNSAGNQIQNLYPGFKVSIQVIYDQDMNSVADTIAGTMKLVTVTVNTPGPESQALHFSMYQGNY